MPFNLFKNPRFDRLVDTFMPVLAVVLALLVGAVMLIMMGANPITAYKGLWEGAFGTKNAFSNTLIKATPLLLVGIGICISFRGGVVNIGGEGQMIAGGVAALAVGLHYKTSDPQVIIPACLIASFLAGAAWGGLAGALKAYFSVNEILSTIMLNQIAAFGMMYLVRTQFIDPQQQAKAAPIPESERLPRTFDLPRIGHRLDDLYKWLGLSPGDQLWARTLVNNGIIIAIVLAIVVYVLLWHTTIGYRIRAVGKNPRASGYAGIRVKPYTVYSLLYSGGLAGLAGGVQLLGGIGHRMNAESGAISFTGNAGFNGIVVALFGGLNPIGTIPASILFGALLVGSINLQKTANVPSAMIPALIGLIIVFVVASDILVRYRTRPRISADAIEIPPTDAAGVKASP